MKLAMLSTRFEVAGFNPVHGTEQLRLRHVPTCDGSREMATTG